MRLHNITITPRGVTLDGQRLTVLEDIPLIEPIGLDMSIVHLPVIAEHVTIAGDTHDPDEPTPLYDQLMDDTYGKPIVNMTHNGHPVRVTLIEGNTK